MAVIFDGCVGVSFVMSAMFDVLQSLWKTNWYFFGLRETGSHQGQGQSGIAMQPMPAPMVSVSLSEKRRLELIRKQQWMYGGYPMFSKWMGSSDEGVVIRRFDELHARVLLKMQNDIVKQERLLHKIDERHSQVDENATFNNGSFYSDESLHDKDKQNLLGKRHAILTTMEKKLAKYDQMILNYRTLRSDPEPPAVLVKNVQNYLTGRGHYPASERGDDPDKKNQGPISDLESEFIYQQGDLLALAPRDKQPLRRLMERYDWLMLGRWFRQSPNEGKQYTDFKDTTHYQSDAKIDTFITALTLLLGLALLIGPVQLLDRLPETRQKLNAICYLIAGFMLVMVLVMPAKPWETLAATAAYSAVLMVFMQIDTSSAPDGGAGS